MSVVLTDDEWRFLSSIPEHDLVELAIDLDVLVPEVIDRRALLDRCILLILDRARSEGLPLSKYDRADIEQLVPASRAAVARLQGLSGDASVVRILKAGQKVYRQYEKTRPGSAVAMLLPSLLEPLARIAAHLDGAPEP